MSSQASGAEHEGDGVDAFFEARLAVQRERAMEGLDPGEKRAMKRSIQLTQDW